MNLRFFVLALLLTIFCQSVGNAQESKPWWNPFASSTSESTSSVVRESKEFGTASTGMKMPEFKLPNWSKSKPTMKKKQPSMMTRASSTTKKWWTNTVDFMNPFDDDSSADKSNGYQPQKQTKAGKGMFGWMTKEETTEKSPTIQSWLGNPRPGFDR